MNTSQAIGTSLRKLSQHQNARRAAVLSIAAVVAGAMARSTHAASQTWSGATDANWTTATNWSGSAVPGINPSGNSTNTTDVATFSSNQANGTTSPLIIDSNRMIGSIVFNTSSAGSYNIGALTGSPTLMFGNGLTVINEMSTVVNAQTINAPIALHLPSSTNGAATIVNNSSTGSAALTLAGGIVNSPNSTRGTAWTLSGTNTGNNTISGVISITNSGGIASTITKTGTGTWALSNSNTIGGGVTVNQGLLIASNAGALGTATSTVTTAGTLEINDVALTSGTLNLNNGGTILGTGGAGSSALKVAVDTTASSTVTLSTGLSTDLLSIGNGTNSLTGGASTSTVNVSGPGTLNLSNASTYIGGWSLNGGVVNLGSATALGTAGSPLVSFGTASAATLNLQGNAISVAGLSTNATPGSVIVENGGGGAAVLTLSGSGSQTFAGVLQDGNAGGNFGLVKSGIGSQTLSGISTYSGSTTVNAGKLILASTGGLGNTAISVNAGGDFSVQPGSGTINAGSTISGSGATLTVNSGSSGLGGTFDMNDNAIGIFNLNQPSTFSGNALTIGGSGGAGNAPTLGFDIGSNNASDLLNVSTGAVSIGASGGRIAIDVLSSLSSINTGNYVLINAPAGGLAPLTLSNSALVVGSGSSAHTYSLSLANSTATQEILTVTAGAPLTAYWKGSTSTSWSTDSSGVTNWVTDHTGATDTQALPGAATTVFFTADNANSANLSTTLDGAFNINALVFTGGTTPAAGNSVTIAAGSSGALTLNAGASFVDSSSNTYNAGTGLVVQAGSAAHTISAPVVLGTSQTWEIDSSAANGLTVSGAISDGGSNFSLTKTGSGTLLLAGSNTYSGGTTLSGGTIQINSTSSLGASTGTLTFNGGTLQMGASVTGSSRNFNIASGQTAIIDTNGFNYSNSGIIASLGSTTGSTTDGLIKNGGGDLNLGGNNTYTGQTVINNGSLTLGVSLALQDSTLNYSNQGGTLSFGTLAAATLGGLTGNESIGLVNTAAGNVALTIGNNGASTSYSGNLSGGGSVTKVGAGTLSLSGSHTYTGNTTLDAGAVVLTGSLNNAANVTAATGGTLNISGGTVSVASMNEVGQGSSIILTGNGSLAVSGVLNLNFMSGGSEQSTNGSVRLLSGNASFGSVAVGRSGDNYGTTIQTSTETNNNLYIDGANVNITGTLGIGNSGATNSSALVHEDAGSVTVAGLTTISDNNNRYSVLDINGGSFNAAGGVQIGGVNAGAYAEWLVRGGVSSTSGITFGDATQSSGSNVLEMLGGTLYVDAGGIAESTAAVFPVTPTVNLGGTTYATAPTLGATAPWSSSLLMTLTNSSSGLAPVIQTANASGGAENITLTGVLQGSGGLTVTGLGTLYLANPSGTGNSYSGLTTLSSGTLNINGEWAMGGSVYGGTTFNGGRLQFASGGPVNGSYDITQTSTAVAKPVTIAAGGGTIDLNGNNVTFASPLGNSGTGALTVTDSSGTGAALTLSSSSTYTGATNIIGGSQLIAGAANVLAPASAFNVSNGTLNASGGAQTVGALTIGSSGILDLVYGNVLTIAGAANFSSGSSLNLTGTPGALPETLASYTSVNGTFTSVTGVPGGDQLLYTGTQLELASSSSGPASLTWNNAGGPGDGLTWDTTQANWNNGSGAVAYSDSSNGSTGDIVTFNDTNNGHYNVSISGLVHPTSVTFNASAGNYTLSGVNASSGIAGTTSLVKIGAGTLTLSTNNSYTGGTNISNGKLVLASANAFPAATPLTIASGATVQVANHGGNATYVPIVSSLSNGGKIDLVNNAMVLQNSSGSISTIQGQVAAGFSNGTWNGSGNVITSSMAAADNKHLTAVGTATGFTSFEGSTVSASDVLLKYTYYGDANLDGKVDGSDYSRIDNGYLSHLTGWWNGDFNYDGVINGSDYTLIDNAFNTQGAQLAAEVASPTAEVAGGSTSAVPEPASLGLIALGTIGLLGRRRRRSLVNN